LPGVDQHDREFDTADAGFQGLWELDLFGRVRRNVEAARADVGVAEATLQDARVSIIAEVARDYFISFGRGQLRRDALQVAAAASDKASDLALKRFEGGLIDFLEVLDAERTALSADLLLSQSRTDTATSLIAVYKALGAGWDLDRGQSRR